MPPAGVLIIKKCKEACMKTSRWILYLIAATALTATLSSCDGMWLGVDSDVGYGGPYYGDPGWWNGYYGPTVNGPAVIPPSRPIYGGLGPVVSPNPGGVPSRPAGAPSRPNVAPSQPSQPSQPSGPSFSPSAPSNPEGVTGTPAVAPGGGQRPGNMGRPQGK